MNSSPPCSRIVRVSVLTALVVGLLAQGVVADVGPQLAFGVDMAKRGLWNEALFRFKEAHRQEPGSARILNNLAVAYEAVGLFDEALEHYQKAVKLDPGNAQLKRNYARFVEFYQSFRPAEPESGEESGGEKGESQAEDDKEGRRAEDS